MCGKFNSKFKKKYDLIDFLINKTYKNNKNLYHVFMFDY